jgi:hypothetical protein
VAKDRKEEARDADRRLGLYGPSEAGIVRKELGGGLDDEGELTEGEATAGDADGDVKGDFSEEV